MPRFFIIDQSLCKAAGHHFDYTRNLALAAADKQYRTLVGANRAFNDPDPNTFSADSVRSCFTNTTYCPFSELHGLRSLTRSPQPPSPCTENDGWLAGRRYRKHTRLRANYVEQFYRDCQIFFADTEFLSGDQVFFLTVSELECEGLARFLAETPSAGLAGWHLQFHFELFAKHGTALDAARRIENVKPIFADMQQRMGDHVFFYATSDGLSQQYNRLDTFRFETLAYPVNAGFFEHRDSNNRKIQVACFGGIRREKGLKTLAPKLVASLEQDSDAREKVELVVQGIPSELSTKARGSNVIRWVPLPAENYVDLVHEADIGLLYYDREAFANRVSSTLNEFLSAGKPVLVSSGSWLHETILSPIVDYQLSMFDRSQVVWSIENLDFDKNLKATSITISLDEFEKAHRLIVIKGDWAEPCHDAAYVTVTATTATKTDVLSLDRSTKPSLNRFVCCTDVSRAAKQVELKFSIVGEDSVIELSRFRQLEIGVLESDQPIPKSQVGIAIANEEDVYAAIQHVSEHLDHFRRTAREFSLQIQVSHRAAATFEQLLLRSNLRRL